jgi:hypothetical protein
MQKTNVLVILQFFTIYRSSYCWMLPNKHATSLQIIFSTYLFLEFPWISYNITFTSEFLFWSIFVQNAIHIQGISRVIMSSVELKTYSQYTCKANLDIVHVYIQLCFANVLWVAFSIQSGSLLSLMKYPVRIFLKNCFATAILILYYCYSQLIFFTTALCL